MFQRVRGGGGDGGGVALHRGRPQAGGGDDVGQHHVGGVVGRHGPRGAEVWGPCRRGHGQVRRGHVAGRRGGDPSQGVARGRRQAVGRCVGGPVRDGMGGVGVVETPSSSSSSSCPDISCCASSPRGGGLVLDPVLEGGGRGGLEAGEGVGREERRKQVGGGGGRARRGGALGPVGGGAVHGVGGARGLRLHCRHRRSLILGGRGRGGGGAGGGRGQRACA